MAARQDQTLVIALIVFVCIAVLGLAWGYLMFKSSSDAHKRITALETELQSEQNAVRTKLQENQSYLRFMGLGENEELEAVTATYEEDMARYGSTFDESQRNYRRILEAIYEENVRGTAREADTKEQLHQLNERLAAVEEEKEAQVRAYEQQMKKAEEDAAQQRNQFARDRAELEATKQGLLESKEQQKAFYVAELAKRDQQLADLTGRLTSAERARNKLLEERATSSESFEVPDGRVSWVNQDGTVWINLGAADALRPQVTFSVYDAEFNDPAKAEKKAHIEVTRVLGQHMSEARVTEDSSTNPILSGDYVYSQVWHRGKRLRFALTGWIDIDGDGRSDLRKVMDLIDINGGVVDAYLNDEGQQEGEMTVDTRYLVLGEFPDSPLKAAFVENGSKMVQSAEDKGVETVSMFDFLNQIGYTEEERTVRLGQGARSGDFPATSSDGDRSNPAAKFRRRTPYRLPSATPY